MKSDIFEQTNGGEKVFQHYLPNLPANLKKKFKLRDGEKTASASIKEVQGVWILKDFGSNEKATNAIDFIMGVYALSYINACIKIIQDLSLPIDIDGKTIYDYVYPKFDKMIDIPSEVVDGLWKTRRISEVIVKKFALFMSRKFITQANAELDCIVFPFFEDGVIVNAKNRGKFEYKKGEYKKVYQLEKDGKRVFFNIDSITPEVELGVITEGEFDVLAVEQALLTLDEYNRKTPDNSIKSKKIGVISVSNGVGSLFDNLTLCLDKLKTVKEWIVFVDDDVPGRKLEDEFIRRIGRNKCRIAKKYGYKDANDLLISKGEEHVLQALDFATFSKIDGLIEFKNYENRLDYIYKHGLPQGLKLGFSNERGEGFDNYFSMLTKTVTVVTGIPTSGKSTFVDTISCLMAKKYGWKTAYFSPEYPDVETHASRLINTLSGYRFRKFEGEQSHEILNEYDYYDSKQFVKNNLYHFESPTDDNDRIKEVTLDMVYSFMEDMVARYGVKHIVLDPLNKIGNDEKFGSGGLPKFMNKFFNELNYFKKYLNIAITVVAHPTKLDKKRKFDFLDTETGETKSVMWYNVPTGYDIFGGSEIYNQVDSIISVYRIPTELENTIGYPKGYCQAYVQKMKLDYLGKHGASEFVFNGVTRQYTCIDSTNLNEFNMNPLQSVNPTINNTDDEPPF